MVAPVLDTMTEGGGGKVELSELVDVGKRLSHPSSSKDTLCNVLEQASMLFSSIQQLPHLTVLSAMKSSMDALVQPGLLKHKDKDVRLLVTACISEIMRIVAPDAPYSDDILKEIFELIVASFKGLNERESRFFDKRLKILESVATVRSCVVMLDLECDDLIREMFQTFFQTVSEEPKNIILAMRAIMCLVLEESEEIPLQLLEVLLRNLLLGRKGVSNAGYALARAVFERCAEQLRPHVEAFLTSTISEGKLYKSKWKESYHDLIFEISKLDPRLIIPLVPKLIDELQTDKLEVRLRAVRSVGRLLASCKGTLPEGLSGLFTEMLGRFSDSVVDVRLAVIEFAKHYLLANPSGANADDLLAAFFDRLQDHDAAIRGQVVVTICDYAKSNLELVPIDTLKKASECLWDAEAFVRRETFQQLTELHRTFCLKISEGSALELESFCWIPSKLISCSSDGESKDFRVQALEMVFSEQLFPVEFSTENRVKCWILSFDAFDEKCVKAFERILSEKQRLHQEMQIYFATLPTLKDKESEENERSLQEACKRMASFFVEPAEAVLQLQKLSQLNDTKLVEIIADLLDSKTSSFKSSCLREDLLKSHAGSDIGHDFLRALAIKCSFALFDKEHMQELLNTINKYRSLGDEKMLKASIGLLTVITRHFPSLLEGAEADILELLKDDRDYIEEVVVQILAKIGSSISRELLDKFNSVNLLEKLCIEGSRKKAKYAVQALSALSGNLGSEVLTTLYGKLLDLVKGGVNLPTTLQSLGCIAQHSSSSFKAQQEDLVKFLIQDLFKRDSGSLVGENSEQHGSSETTRLKIFGLKMFVKGILQIEDSQQIELPKELFEILLKLLKFGEISDKSISSDSDKAQLRLAAATAVLRLSKCYNSQISPQLFHATVICAKDPDNFVKLGFIQKLHKLISAQAVSTEYACAFALSIDGGDGGLLEEAKLQLCNFIKSAQNEKQSRHLSSVEESETSVLSYFPQYVLFYLVHILAQETTFSSLSDGGPTLEDIEPVFRQLYLFIWALLTRNGEGTRIDTSKDDDLDRIALIFGIFSAMKNAEDAVDASKTENTYILCDIGINLIKDLLGDEFASMKVVDNIPLPLAIYRGVEDISEGSQKSYLPPILEEGDTFSKLKGSLPFGIDVAVKQGKRKADSGSLKDVKMPPQKRSKGTEVLQGEKKEGQKKSGNDKVRPVETEVNSQEPDHATPVSPKRKRGGQYSHENGEVSSGRVDETLLKSSHKPKSLKVSVDEVEDVKLGGISAPELVSPVGSATKRVRISIKKPKLPSEPVAAESPKQEDSSELKKRGRKKGQVMDGPHDDSLRDEGTAEAQAQPLTSPRGTPRRSLKNATSSGLESPNSRVDEDEETSTQELVGCRIKVWWPMDKKFYQGVIRSYQPSKKKHKVVYEDGDVEFLKLENERWELLKDPKELPGSPSTKSHVEHGLQSKEKKVDSHSRNSNEGSDRRRSGKHGKSKKSPSSTKHVEPEPEIQPNESDDTEIVDQGHEMVDGGETPASAVPKSRKSSEKNGSVGKRASGKSSDLKPDDHTPGGSPSRDSRDSGDVPLKVWKSGRRKAH